jgi:hypothetical protein
MMILCPSHHTGTAKNGIANGIHCTTLPAWMSQKVCRLGSLPMPADDDEDYSVGGTDD